MATLHINEKVCTRNCKKNTIAQLTGPASLSQALHRGPGKTEEGCLEALPPLASSNVQ